MSTSHNSSLAARVLAGETQALARGISLVEDNDPAGWSLVRELYPHTGRAAVVGFTGSPGAGKSTLISALVTRLRARRRRVAVLSIDPSSPFRGGAVLGDRIRLSEHFLDRGVFIRSMATRGAFGGLAEAATQATLLMDAAGFDDVLLETVGVGQAEVDVVGHADTVVLVLIPGAGDSVQALKAGVMEIPDVIVVNKADHPLADTMVRQVRSVLSLAPHEERPVQIVKTEAIRGEGVEKLLEALQQHRSSIAQEGLLAERRGRNLMNEVLALAGARLQVAIAAAVRDDPAAQELLDAVVARHVDPASAARAILRARRPSGQVPRDWTSSTTSTHKRVEADPLTALSPRSRDLSREDRWLRDVYRATPERRSTFTTLSGEPIRPLYTERDLPADPDEAIGLPGQYPFTRGVYPSMYRGRLWTVRQFAGFGTAEETNGRFRYLLEHGQTGLSTAFDMPSLMGYDSDHARSLGEVGREGVAVDTVDDMETLFGGIDLGKVSVSMTINAPAAIMMAFYVVAAERQGVPPERLAGTIQADILKEYIAQKEWCFPGRSGDARAGRHDGVVHAQHAALESRLDFGLPHPRGRGDGCAGARVHAQGRTHLCRGADRSRDRC